MCGLIGTARLNVDADEGSLFTIKETTTPLDPDAMLALIRHRGPDGEGHARFGDRVLGHTRLAIQDTTTASAQPFTSGPITLTYNGELWNADSLDVGQRVTTGDTEVVARMLELYGVDGLNRLDGMWAMAWHDARDDCIWLARDPFGKIPLYMHTQRNGVICWASEYKALPRATARPVAPGEIVCIPPDGPGFTQAWINPPEHPEALEPCPETVLALLSTGVTERLVGDRPIAYMLSGGLDSSFILGLVTQNHPERQIVAYTAVGDPASPDLAAARYVANHFGVELVEVKIPEVDQQTIELAVRTVEVPMKAQIEIALAHLPIIQAMASDGFRVCLSGEAADELFGGYGGMQIKASSADDAGYNKIKLDAVEKMARGNFTRVNKVGMAHGVECRLPFMESRLVRLALNATKAQSPPGKTLLKLAAKGLVPDHIIARPKDTFQGATGTALAAATVLTGNPTAAYNQIARTMFGQIPKG